eukprot:gi/632935986/ref/XP_007892021.1/ PREDICTED: potassium voltage-gated channel subfamily E member 1-like protein [Callorhinchus milii]
MNCSAYDRLETILRELAMKLPSANRTSTKRSPDKDSNKDAYLYILLIMIFYAFLAGGLILAYTRSRDRHSGEDPYHIYFKKVRGSGKRVNENKNLV